MYVDGLEEFPTEAEKEKVATIRYSSSFDQYLWYWRQHANFCVRIIFIKIEQQYKGGGSAIPWQQLQEKWGLNIHDLLKYSTETGQLLDGGL